MAGPPPRGYRFVASSDLLVPLSVRLNVLDAPPLSQGTDVPYVHVSLRLVTSVGAPLGARRTMGADAVSRSTRARRVATAENAGGATPAAAPPPLRYGFGKWFDFCVNICDLPRDATLEMHVLASDAEQPRLIGAVALPLFTATRGRLRTGRYRLVMDVPPQSATDASAGAEVHAEAERLLRLLRQRQRTHSAASTAGVAWLDKLVDSKLSATLDAQAASAPVLDITLPHAALPCHFGEAAPDGLGGIYLGVPPSTKTAQAKATPSARKSTSPQARRMRAPSAAPPPTMWSDPELDTESPAERMAAKLARPLGRRAEEMDGTNALQPDTSERRRLDACVAMPPHRPLGTEAKALVWRFRRALMTDAKALPKFLHAVDWLDPEEAKHALDLMHRWSPIGTLEALELLGPSGAALAARAGGAGVLSANMAGVSVAASTMLPASNAALMIRRHAVTALERMDDETLLNYLPQLVQALRYENARSMSSTVASGDGGDGSGEAATTLPSGTAAAAMAAAASAGPLSRFLVRRSTASLRLAVPLHWYLYVEWDDSPTGAFFTAVHSYFMETLRTSSPSIVDVLQRQDELSIQLSFLVKELRSQRNAARKTERLQTLLSPTGACSELASFEPALPYMLDTSVRLTGIVGEESFVFKSALSPLKLTFRTEAGRVSRPPKPLSPRGLPSGSVKGDGFADGQNVHIIYKKGDDLRQDQLILQMIRLMDSMLKAHGGLDLKLIPYQALATGPDSGFVELVVGAKNVSHVLSEHKSILGYLRTTRPAAAAASPLEANSGVPTRMRGASVAIDASDEAELENFAASPPAAAAAGPATLADVDAVAIDNFVRSCAGYSVITYLLGVGDRHLDNLMLCPDGRMFHIDFGFILGRDPKPYPPPMKLIKEMVDAMGGANSDLYRVTFVSLCVEAFNILRKNTNLFLHLFHMMSHSGLPDISSVGGGQKALLKLEERFRADLSDEEAGALMVSLLNESVTALFPRAVEAVHRIAQMVR